MVVFHMLMKAGSDITITDITGSNVVHLAAQYGRDYVILYGLNKGIDINSRGKNNNNNK